MAIDRRTAVTTLLALGSAAPALPAEAAAPSPSNGGERDFDFLIGRWKVRHRRIKERLAGSTEWIEFDGSQEAQLLLGGAGNVDDNVFDLDGKTVRAATLRTFDPATTQWSIWYVDTRAPLGPIDPPVRGRFENGVGQFFADDSFAGRPIRVRFTWISRKADGNPHWEQAFSADGGATWETNWVMDYTRAA